MGRKLEEPAELILQLCSELKISSVNIYWKNNMEELIGYVSTKWHFYVAQIELHV
jgi:hypothetical protein